MNNAQKCPIWGTPAEIAPPTTRTFEVDSARAGGRYSIVFEAASGFGGKSDLEKAKLTTWLIDQRRQGVSSPKVTPDVLAQVERFRPISAHERADRLLEFLASNSPTIGAPVETKTPMGVNFRADLTRAFH